ncbi:MAG: PilN domain-containing protein [Pseudomonadales bacterium]|nr:PilN domain-containing protein [Pseudomonadales bacterium]
MANINLLPWRDERREELKKEFLAILAAVAVFAAAIVMVWQFILSDNISVQNERNQFLTSRISELDDQVKEIQALKKKKKELIERMTVIQSLQGNRPEIVHIFDEIVRTLPDGVYYHSIERNGSVMKLTGSAESNNRVSSLMRQLDASEWFASPNLRQVQASKFMGGQGSDFVMDVQLVSPTVEADNGTEK